MKEETVKVLEKLREEYEKYDSAFDILEKWESVPVGFEDLELIEEQYKKGNDDILFVEDGKVKTYNNFYVADVVSLEKVEEYKEELEEERMFELDRKSEFLESFETRKYLKKVEEVYYSVLMTNIRIKVNTLDKIGLEISQLDYETEKVLETKEIDLSSVPANIQNIGLLILAAVEVSEKMDEEKSLKSEGILEVSDYLIFEKGYKKHTKFEVKSDY